MTNSTVMTRTGNEVMNLEEINNIEDKEARLKLLEAYVLEIRREQRAEDEIVSDDAMNASRDEAFGMMSRFGKPEAE
jgi:hypothetical protein